MSYGFRAGLLFAFLVSAAPVAVHAYPAAGPGAQTANAQTPIVRAGCYYDDCWYPRRDYWRPRYYGYWRPRFSGWEGDPGYYVHSRYWSHYRWGSYHRLWRPCDPCGWDY